ncbi:MAG: hypothetical protein L6R39_000956 [Caloplaca ligustica]|nr:MAG: hypothetical protein L6R39_000956 [Caloplaca ligustica]
MDLVLCTPSFRPSYASYLSSSTASWSLSFYPQPILNLRRRSTAGTTPSFPFINTLGFLSYLTSTLAFYASPLIRHQYAIRNPSAPDPTVRFNDVVFALHGVVLSTLVWSMFAKRIWGFEQGAGQRVGTAMWAVAIGCVIAVLAVTVYVASAPSGGYDAEGWAWIDVVYTVSYIKLLITVVKYIPQVRLNYERKSTVGWSIEQILLDLVGGILSVVQLVIDSLLEGDWSGLTGNPVKFGLGNVSVVFNIIFILQHYVFYREPRRAVKELEVEDGERSRLLG